MRACKWKDNGNNPQHLRLSVTDKARQAGTSRKSAEVNN